MRVNTNPAASVEDGPRSLAHALERDSIYRAFMYFDVDKPHPSVILTWVSGTKRYVNVATFGSWITLSLLSRRQFSFQNKNPLAFLFIRFNETNCVYCYPTPPSLQGDICGMRLKGIQAALTPYYHEYFEELRQKNEAQWQATSRLLWRPSRFTPDDLESLYLTVPLSS
jgi:hypothetical protein